MARKFKAGIDLQGNEAKGFRPENLADAPSSPKKGQQYFNTTQNDMYFWNGTEWKSASGSVYTLPKAAADVLGGVQIGDNIQVDSANGKISVFDATNAQKGVIQIATDAEATAGTDEAKAINAKQLKTAADAAQAAAESAINAKVGVASGIASLDANAKIPTSQLPDQIVGQMLLGGSFDGNGVATISSNLQKKLGISDATIQLINSATDDTSKTVKEYGYKSLEGVYFLADATFEIGGVTFEVGDWLVGFGTKWAKIDNTDAVVSVAGKTGAITLEKADVGLGNVDNTSDADKPVSTAQQTALDARVNKDQTAANADKVLRVGSDGNLAVSDSSIEAQNPAITPASGVASWEITNSFNSRKVSVKVYEMADGSEVDMDVKVTAAKVTLSWNADANVAADTYFAVITH